ncbi:MAG TPA: metallophosphoesterase [Oligoflexia bacterium]|nr:metallophosphoesterase [Oligoflexia bacterium]HMP27167.1 metallophosphoesterase [Oligoflexia bacterium]
MSFKNLEKNKIKRPIFSRRSFLFGAAGVTTLAASSSYLLGSLSIDTNNIQVEEVFIGVKNLPGALRNFRIALIADIHYGVFVKGDLIEEVVEAVNKLKPDLIILLGDYIGLPDSLLGKAFAAKLTKDSDFREFKHYTTSRSAAPPELIMAIFEKLSRILRKLHSPRQTLAILGNHDGWLDTRAGLKKFEEAGIKVMGNETLSMRVNQAELKIVAVEDFWTGIPRIDYLTAAKKDQEVRILLAHNPDYVTEIIGEGNNKKFDLALSGHTHGGQIVIPLLGALGGYNLIYNRFKSGLHRTKTDHNLQVYVSRGIGVIEIPYRINCRPEISLITLN